MKKFIFAILALCAMAVSFTSCNTQADPLKEPIAGKTYQYTDEAVENSYIKVAFLMNHKTVITVKQDLNETVQDLLVWKMEENARNFRIVWANGAINTQTGQDVSGMTLYDGVYNAEAKQIVLTMAGTQQPIQYVMEEIQ